MQYSHWCIFFLLKVEFMHPVSLLRTLKALSVLLSPIPSILFSLKSTLIRLSLPLPAALVKEFDLFDKSNSQVSAQFWYNLSEVFETVFPSLTFGVCTARPPQSAYWLSSISLSLKLAISRAQSLDFFLFSHSVGDLTQCHALAAIPQGAHT